MPVIASLTYVGYALTGRRPLRQVVSRRLMPLPVASVDLFMLNLSLFSVQIP